MGRTVTTERLLAEYRRNAAVPLAVERLSFDGVGDRDVYNPSGIFTDASGRELLAGRVEERTSEWSKVVVFERAGGVWQVVPDAAALDLQDPFVFHHAGTRYLGGVEITEVEGEGGTPVFAWRTVVMDHSDMSRPATAFTGPWGMKDLRFVDLADGRLGVFTRPQGSEDGRGRIGFTTVDSLAALTIDDVAAAPRLERLFVPEEWGGVNHAWLLDDGRLGVLGHIAAFDDDGARHYYPISFAFDPATSEVIDPRILFERRDLPDGPAKRADLHDVIFPGWADVAHDPQLVVCGASDAEVFAVGLPAGALVS
ncbi:DUF1861 family protein [Agromyces sp. NPDC049794]|uniref:DUF1861 family protein n=1 Tax=unclassified Agromyces TaxID=2639701 RepID=UPI0033C0182B